MPMHPDVERAEVRKVSHPDGKIDSVLYLIDVPGVGAGYGSVENTFDDEVPKIGYFSVSQERAGLATRLLQEAVKDLGDGRLVHGYIVHEQTIHELSLYSAISHLEGNVIEVSEEVYTALPAVHLLSRAGIVVTYLTLEHWQNANEAGADVVHYIAQVHIVAAVEVPVETAQAI